MIQAGIDAAIEGDVVVVYPDTYYENIVINKTITLTSLALFDTSTNTLSASLETWFSDDYPIVVSDEYINTTIIDGSEKDSSTVIITGSSCIAPKIQGFTIQGGQGTKMDRFYKEPEGFWSRGRIDGIDPWHFSLCAGGFFLYYSFVISLNGSAVGCFFTCFSNLDPLSPFCLARNFI